MKCQNCNHPGPFYLVSATAVISADGKVTADDIPDIDMVYCPECGIVGNPAEFGLEEQDV